MHLLLLSSHHPLLNGSWWGKASSARIVARVSPKDAPRKTTASNNPTSTGTRTTWTKKWVTRHCWISVPGCTRKIMNVPFARRNFWSMTRWSDTTGASIQRQLSWLRRETVRGVVQGGVRIDQSSRTTGKGEWGWIIDCSVRCVHHEATLHYMFKIEDFFVALDCSWVLKSYKLTEPIAKSPHFVTFTPLLTFCIFV